jgi:ABC-2 type transport system ATP-binding protein
MIEARELHKAYGATPALQGVSLAIGRGEIVGLLGPNGAGKSTAMRILCGVLVPDAGEVRIDGLDLAQHPRAARARIGYLPEGTPLYRGMRVRELVHFAGALRGLRAGALASAVERALAQCGLAGRERARVHALSKGYRQRVGLALALVGDPPVLVLDEPTSGLDPTEVQRMRALVRELARERAVLVSTHVLSEVEDLCARAFILAGGRVVAQGELEHIAGARERLELTLACGSAAPAELATRVQRELAALACVRKLHLRNAPRAQTLAFELEVDERWGAAESVSAHCAAAGWRVLELSAPRPSLERAFLAAVSGAAAP